MATIDMALSDEIFACVYIRILALTREEKMLVQNVNFLIIDVSAITRRKVILIFL